MDCMTLLTLFTREPNDETSPLFSPMPIFEPCVWADFAMAPKTVSITSLIAITLSFTYWKAAEKPLERSLFILDSASATKLMMFGRAEDIED